MYYCDDTYLLYVLGGCFDQLCIGAIVPENSPCEVGVVLGDEVDDWFSGFQPMGLLNQLDGKK